MEVQLDEKENEEQENVVDNHNFNHRPNLKKKRHSRKDGATINNEKKINHHNSIHAEKKFDLVTNIPTSNSTPPPIAKNEPNVVIETTLTEAKISVVNESRSIIEHWFPFFVSC